METEQSICNSPMDILFCEEDGVKENQMNLENVSAKKPIFIAHDFSLNGARNGGQEDDYMLRNQGGKGRSIYDEPREMSREERERMIYEKETTSATSVLKSMKKAEVKKN